MSLAIGNYKEAVQAIASALAWKSMIGKTFSGGGGGTGYVSGVETNITIYFQERDGSKNYHEIPAPLEFALRQVIKENAHQLLGKAIKRMEADRDEAAEAAVKEHAELMREAGLLKEIA